MTEFLTPAMFFALSAGLVTALVAASRPVFGLVLLILVTVAIDLATHQLQVMAAAGAIIIFMLLLSVLREKQLAFPGEPIRVKTSIDKYFAWLAVLAMVYLIVGFARGNKATFILGDAFHLLFEMSITFFLCTIILRRPERLERFTHSLALWMLILSALVLALYATGLLAKLPGAGQYYRQSHMFRIRVNPNYPLLPLVWLLGIWLFQAPGRWKRITGFACIALTIVLALTLKRTLWIAFVLTLIFYFFAVGFRQRVQALRTVFIVVVVAVIAANVFVPEDVFNPEELRVYTHSIQKRFTAGESDVDVSFANRLIQLGDALAIAVRNPLGYGLGNEAVIRFSEHSVPAPIHYVHNAFVHYGLLMGIWYPLLMIGLSVQVVKVGLQTFRRLPEGYLKGSALGALGCYVSILIAAITEIGTNTYFLGMSAAAVMLVERTARAEGLIPGRQTRPGVTEPVS